MEHTLSELISATLGDIKRLIDTQTVIGSPIVSGEATVIPVNRVTVGVVGADGLKGRAVGEATAPTVAVGGIGSGATVTPIGFLVVDDGGVNFVKTQGDGIDKWLDIVQSTIKNIVKSAQ